MFYRVTRDEYPQERYDEILEWANPKTRPCVGSTACGSWTPSNQDHESGRTG